jgi:succinate dehydrogenase/fumarate reductase flavoprotein subunit
LVAIIAVPSDSITLLTTKSGKSHGADFTQRVRAWCDATELPRHCVFAGCARRHARLRRCWRSVLLEKSTKLGGGTLFSIGGIWIGCNHLMLAAGYKDTRNDVLSYMRFVGGDETDDERLVAYVDRGPEALRFFDHCGIRFRISRGLTDHYFGVARDQWPRDAA